MSDILSGYRESSRGIIFVTDRTGRLIASSSGMDSITDQEGQRARAVQHENSRIAAAASAAGLPRSGDQPLDSAAGPVEFAFSLDNVRDLGLKAA